MFLIIDSHAVLHRAYHALPKTFKRGDGELINAVYGFFSMLTAACAELRPKYLAACFDADQGTFFRNEYFVGYQMKRKETESELKSQIKITKEVLIKAEIPVFIKPKYEADDLIGTITKKVLNLKSQISNRKIVVVTGDKDLTQLVSESVSLYLLKKGVSEADLVNPAGVEKILGVKPDQVVDYKALVGDSSDNYPGVSGIGPVGAAKLLRKYQSLKNIYVSLEEIEPVLREKLKKGKDSAYLSRKLARIHCKAPLKLNLKKARFDEDKKRKIKEVLVDLHFPSLVKRWEKYFGEEKKRVEQMKLV